MTRQVNVEGNRRGNKAQHQQLYDQKSFNFATECCSPFHTQTGIKLSNFIMTFKNKNYLSNPDDKRKLYENQEILNVYLEFLVKSYFNFIIWMFIMKTIENPHQFSEEILNFFNDFVLAKPFWWKIIIPQFVWEIQPQHFQRNQFLCSEGWLKKNTYIEETNIQIRMDCLIKERRNGRKIHLKILVAKTYGPDAKKRISLYRVTVIRGNEWEEAPLHHSFM